jgi:hypothetical protein
MRLGFVEYAEKPFHFVFEFLIGGGRQAFETAFGVEFLAQRHQRVFEAADLVVDEGIDRPIRDRHPHRTR